MSSFPARPTQFRKEPPPHAPLALHLTQKHSPDAFTALPFAAAASNAAQAPKIEAARATLAEHWARAIAKNVGTLTPQQRGAQEAAAARSKAHALATREAWAAVQAARAAERAAAEGGGGQR